jgi:hypothetical protein
MSKVQPREIVALHFAGDLLLPRLKDNRYQKEFARFQALFEHLANLDRQERCLNYALLNCLMLTSHARLAEKEAKLKLFDLKNRLYVALANASDMRRSVAFKYLKSPKKLVVKLCAKCELVNQEKGIKTRHDWIYCNACETREHFFDVLSMFHRFDKGSASVVISQENIPQIKNLRIKHQGHLDKGAEMLKFKSYQFDKKNLDRIVLDDAIRMNEKILKTLTDNLQKNPSMGAQYNNTETL